MFSIILLRDARKGGSNLSGRETHTCEDRIRDELLLVSRKWGISACICLARAAFYIGILSPPSPGFYPRMHRRLTARFHFFSVSSPSPGPLKRGEWILSRRRDEGVSVGWLQFPSRPLFLSYTYARVRTYIHTWIGTVGVPRELRVFPPFLPPLLHYLFRAAGS